jgi:hypothetical protein
MNIKPAVILLFGTPNSGKRWITDYFIKSRRENGASVECISFRQAKIQSAVATLAAAHDVLFEGVDFKTVSTFPLSKQVQEFHTLVDSSIRRENPTLLAHWIMTWIRLKFQDGCQLFIIPDLEYADDVTVFQRFKTEFEFRFVHVHAPNRTTIYLRNKKPSELEQLPDNIELEKKEEAKLPKRLTPEIMKTEFPGLFHFFDNSADGTEQIKSFRYRTFFDLKLRVDPPFPWAIFAALVAALIGVYIGFYK